METLRVAATIVTITLMLFHSASTQQAVSPPPRPTEVSPTTSGPSLDATLQFIADKVNAVGEIIYIASEQNSVDGSTEYLKVSVDYRPVTFDTTLCRVNYHKKLVVDGTVSLDGNNFLLLKNVVKIQVANANQEESQILANAGLPEITATVAPSLTSVIVQLNGTYDSGIQGFKFRDSDDADRVAKAFLHAVELCGGGNKDPF